jgi:hypothetical protein
MIDANGTVNQPIVFTSNESAGSRSYGDWGGIIICGNAPVNLAGGEGVIEGGTNALFGGGMNPNPNDNSGILRYIRIEFSGIPFQPNQEINGLTMGGVGAGTTIEYIQISYCGDDSYEWFGGNVNSKYLIAFRGWDDDFDSDNGFSGKIQFAVSMRDPNIADQSGSNGFESDNDATGSGATPNTSPVFSNVSVFGPKATSSTNINSQYQRAAHLRRNTRTSIFNSVLAGYPTGLLIDAASTEGNATNNDLQVRNTIISGMTNPLAVISSSSWDINSWFNTPTFGNTIYTNNSDLMINYPDAASLTNPNLIPMSGSPLMSGADFSHSKLQDPYFDVVNFKGAFGTVDWTAGWTNWDPQNTNYILGVEDYSIISNTTLYPNPATEKATVNVTLKESVVSKIDILDITGKSVKSLPNMRMKAGFNSLDIDLSELKSGFYFVKIEAGSSVQTLKLIVK